MDQRVKIFLKNSYVWMRGLEEEKVHARMMIMGTPHEEHYNRIFIEDIKDNAEIQQKVSIHVPYFKVNVEKKECLRFIEMAQRLGESYKSLLSYH